MNHNRVWPPKSVDQVHTLVMESNDNNVTAPEVFLSAKAALRSPGRWDDCMEKWLRLIQYLIPKLTPSVLDRQLHEVLPMLVTSLGCPRPKLRRELIQVLFLSVKHSVQVEVVLDALAQHGIASDDLEVRKQSLICTPILLQGQVTQAHCQLLRERLIKLRDARHDPQLDSHLNVALSKMDQLRPGDVPSSSSDEISYEDDYEEAGDSDDDYASSDASTDPSCPDYEFGVFPAKIIHQLRNGTDDFQRRSEAIELLSRHVYQLNDVGAVVPHMMPLLLFLEKLLDDQNFKVKSTTLDILGKIIDHLQHDIQPHLHSLINILIRNFDENTPIMRQSMMKIIRSLMDILQPTPIIAQLASALAHRNARVRQQTLNVIIAALITYPSSDFDLTDLCMKVAPLLLDPKRMVRIATLECFAVIGQQLGPGGLTPIANSVEPLEEQLDGSGALDAVTARLSRKKLPRVGNEGQVEYFISPNKLTGLDIDWVKVGSTATGSSAGSARNQSSPMLRQSQSRPLVRHRGSAKLFSVRHRAPPARMIDKSQSARERVEQLAESQLPNAQTKSQSARTTRAEGASEVDKKNNDEEMNQSLRGIRNSATKKRANRMFEKQLSEPAIPSIQTQKTRPPPRLLQNLQVSTNFCNENGVTPRGPVKALRPLKEPFNLSDAINTSSPLPPMVNGGNHRTSVQHDPQEIMAYDLETPLKEPRNPFTSRSKLTASPTTPPQPAPRVIHSRQGNRPIDVASNANYSMAGPQSMPDNTQKYNLQYDVDNGNGEVNDPITFEYSAVGLADGAHTRSRVLSHDETPVGGNSGKKDAFSVIGKAVRRDSVSEQPFPVFGDALQASSSRLNGAVNVSAAANEFTSPTILDQQPPTSLPAARALPPRRKRAKPKPAKLGTTEPLPADRPPPELKAPKAAAAAAAPRKHTNNARDVRSAGTGLTNTLQKLDAPDEEWETKCEGLNEISQLVVAQTEVIVAAFNEVLIRVLREVSNLRSNVCKTAINCCGELFACSGKHLDTKLDKMAEVLLGKCSEANQFILEAVELSLGQMQKHVAPVRCVMSLIVAGSEHRNKAVRAVTSRHVAATLEGMSSVDRTKLLTVTKDNYHVVRAAAFFLQAGEPETRYNGLRVFHALMEQPGYEAMLAKHISSKQLAYIKDKLESLRCRGLPAPPKITGSAKSGSARFAKK